MSLWREDSNYQDPPEKQTEIFHVVLILKNHLILRTMDGNNIRVKCPNSNLYKIEEKIYKENGEFLWQK